MRPVAPPSIAATDLRLLFPALDLHAEHSGRERAVAWDLPMGMGTFDGVWRRRDRQLVPEIEWLIGQVELQFTARVTRLGLPLSGWDLPHPPRIWFNRTLVHIAWYAAMNPASATVTTGRLMRSLIVVDDLPVARDPGCIDLSR